MPVELTPSGTRGSQLPKMPRPIMKLFMGLFAAYKRLSGSRMLNLTTVGAKSGNSHTVPLSWFPDGDNAWLVVASFGGAAKHPAWYVNMAKNQDKVSIELGKRKLKVTPESLTGAARQNAWQRIIAVAPGYATYQQNTDREIPVVRLTPAPAEP